MESGFLNMTDSRENKTDSDDKEFKRVVKRLLSTPPKPHKDKKKKKKAGDER